MNIQKLYGALRAAAALPILALAVVLPHGAAGQDGALSDASRNGSSDSVYTVLKNDHRNVQKLFQQILRDNRRSDETFARAQNALDAHMRAEERYFYPILERDSKGRPALLAAREEHEAAKTVLGKVGQSDDDQLWLARVKVLSDLIDHHIDQEESRLFGEAKRLISKQQSMDLGRTVQDELNRAQR